MFVPKKPTFEKVAEAKTRVENLTVEQVQAELLSGEAQLIDIRDVRELQKEGWIPGSIHMYTGGPDGEQPAVYRRGDQGNESSYPGGAGGDY